MQVSGTHARITLSAGAQRANLTSQGLLKILRRTNSAIRDDGHWYADPERIDHATLKSEVRKTGYGFIEARHVDETSLLVVGKSGDDGGALLGYLKNLGKKYGQDLILHKPHNSDKALPYRTNETEKDKHIEVGFWHANKAAEFLSLMKSRKPITVEEPFHFITEKSFFSGMERLY